MMFRCGCGHRDWWPATTRSQRCRRLSMDALAGRCRGVLVSGAPGVGKTALVDELRRWSPTRWLVRGRQVRPVPARSGVRRRLSGISGVGSVVAGRAGRKLAELRGRIVEPVGANAGLLTATVPEFAALLGIAPDAGDPLTAQVRAQRNAVSVLRAVASPQTAGGGVPR